MKYFKNLSKPAKIILSLLLAAFLVFSFIKTYFPEQAGLSTWRSNINRICLGEPNEADKQNLSVHFIDVGQGDCTLIKSGSFSALIDSGNKIDDEKVCKYILSHNVDELDYFIITHPHSDHYGGAARVIDLIDVKSIILPQIPDSLFPDDREYDFILDKIKKEKIPVYAAKAGDEYSLGDASFTVLSPIKKANNLNDMSVVIRLVYGDTSFMFMGDCEKFAEKNLVASEFDIKCDVLKVGHHGSSASTTKEFLQKTQPIIAVVSCGLDNDYGHPAEDLLYRINKINAYCLRTDLNGNIVIGSDSDKLYCWFEKGEKPDFS